MSARVIKTPKGNYGIIEDNPGVQIEVLGATPVVEVEKPEDLARLKETRSRVKMKEIIGDIVSGQESITGR